MKLTRHLAIGAAAVALQLQRDARESGARNGGDPEEPQLRERVLQGEQRRLRVAGLVDDARFGVAEQRGAAVEQFRTLIDSAPLIASCSLVK